MPNTANAKKALRQSAKRRLHNRSQRSALRTTIKRVRTLLASGEIEAAESASRIATKKLDQAASKNLLHKNTASRIKSRISKALKNAKNPPAAKTE